MRHPKRHEGGGQETFMTALVPKVSTFRGSTVSQQRITLNDTSEVSEIEEIVGFCWSGEQVVHSTLIHCRSCRNNRIPNSHHLVIESLAEVPVNDPAKDEGHGAVVELVDGNGVEVAKETWGDWVATASRWTHGCDEQGIHQIDLCVSITI